MHNTSISTTLKEVNKHGDGRNEIFAVHSELHTPGERGLSTSGMKHSGRKVRLTILVHNLERTH